MAGDLTCHRAHYDVIAMSVVAVSPLGGAWQHRLKATSCGRNWCRGRVFEGIRQYDSSDTGHSDNVNIAAEHQEPAEVLSQLDNTSNSPVYGEYKCC